MRHTIEELGDFADDNADGGFYIGQVQSKKRDCSGGVSPNGKHWFVKIGRGGDEHYGATPDEAVSSALDAHERAPNPDNEKEK